MNRKYFMLDNVRFRKALVNKHDLYWDSNPYGTLVSAANEAKNGKTLVRVLCHWDRIQDLVNMKTTFLLDSGEKRTL